MIVNPDSLKDRMMIRKFIPFACVLLLFTVQLHAQSLVAAEYFWDTDPGQGAGTALTAVDGSFNQSIEQGLATVSSLPSLGSHVFNVRFKDGDNHWGPVFRTTVTVLPNITTTRDIKVTAAEAFWDTDPGQGNGTVMTAFDGNFDQAIETIVKNNLSSASGLGLHKLNIRVKDGAGNWGPVFTMVVNKEANITTTRPIKVAAGEYFWDTDPGAGNGAALLAFDGNFDQSVEAVYKAISVSGLSDGNHLLGIRVKDAAGNWGTLFSVVVEVKPLISSLRPIRVAAGEYFFDNDPGNGNATPMIALDGNFNTAIEQLAGAGIPSPVASGVHTLYIRAKDVNGNWGPRFGVVVNVDTSINTFATNVNGTASFCSPINNPQSYSTPLTSGNTYSWSVIGGSIVAGQGTNAVQVNWTSGGFHSITVIECNNGQTLCDTAQLVINIYSSQTVNQSTSVCDGDSVQIHGQWQSAAGVYSQVYTSSNGCDSTVNVTLSVNPSYQINTTASIVSGDSIYLGGAWRKLPGTWTDNYTTASGCDSVVTTVLTVTFTSLISGASSLCQSQAANISYTATLHNGSGYNWSVNGGTITGSSGINQVTVTWNTAGLNSITVIECNSSFCDTMTLYVTVSTSIQSIVNTGFCPGDSVFAGGAWQTQAGNFYDTIPGVGGCDTVIITNVTAYTNYTDTNNLIINSGDSVFLAGNWQHSSGVYTDHFTSVNGCDSTVVTFLLVVVGLEEQSGNTIHIWPNPGHGDFTIGGIASGVLPLRLFDMHGRLLEYEPRVGNGTRLHYSGLAPGTYLLQIGEDVNKAWLRLEITR